MLPEVKQQVDWPAKVQLSVGTKDNGSNNSRNSGTLNFGYGNINPNGQAGANGDASNQAPQQALANQADVQRMKGQQEYEQRQNAVQTFNDATWASNRYSQAKSPDGMHATVNEGVMKPLWLDDALVLARRVSIHGQEYVQGCWLHWPAVKRELLDGVRDLLPAADLEPVAVISEDKEPRMLAALPLRLKVGDIPLDLPIEKSSVPATLLIAWCSAVIGAAAIGLLLRGVISLSERRGAFVSAVTHELRTPLTTLRMYTEMLADGMVKDEARRQQYLGTLRSEANRLGHLVENVLGYSRLERKRSCARMETAVMGDLLERATPRLQERAAQAGMNVEVECAAGAGEARVMVDLVAVEQILFNLVDNACKYAQPSTRPIIAVTVKREGKSVAIRVRDFGPGIPKELRKTIVSTILQIRQRGGRIQTARPGPGPGPKPPSGPEHGR